MKKNILLVYNNFSTFVKTDYEILSEKYHVEKYQYKPVKGISRNVLEFIKQFLFLTFHIKKYNVIYIWFGDYHSFLPVLFSMVFKKKSFVVIGGYDVANLPEINYGSLSRPLRKKLTLFSFRHATLCLPVVEGLEEKLTQICPKAKSKTIHTGYQFQLNEKLDFDATREKIILTVSITGNYQRYMIKGLDRFKELAKKLPEYKFIVVGVKEVAKSLFEPIPKNLILYPPVEQNELTTFYKQASYYAQFSRSEGLPNALCEAMLYGCIPLGMEVGGVTTAINTNGLLVKDWAPEICMNYVLSNSRLNRSQISNEILNKFALKHRIRMLLEIIN